MFLHRFITLIFIQIFPKNSYNDHDILFALCIGFVTLLLLGSDLVARKWNGMIHKTMALLSFCDFNQNKTAKGRVLKIAAAALLIICLSLPMLTSLKSEAVPVSSSTAGTIIHKVMTDEQAAAVKGAVSLAFVGDLILLQDQIRQADLDSSGAYDFSPMFQYASKYLTEADLAIGVFEGPAAGEEALYSTSNYNDGLPLSLNYPDSFAKAVKNAGLISSPPPTIIFRQKRSGRRKNAQHP